MNRTHRKGITLVLHVDEEALRKSLKFLSQGANLVILRIGLNLLELLLGDVLLLLLEFSHVLDCLVDEGVIDVHSPDQQGVVLERHLQGYGAVVAADVEHPLLVEELRGEH